METDPVELKYRKGVRKLLGKRPKRVEVQERGPYSVEKETIKS